MNKDLRRIFKILPSVVFVTIMISDGYLYDDWKSYAWLITWGLAMGLYDFAHDPKFK